MSALSIRLNEEEKRIIDTYAKFHNKTISQVVKEAKKISIFYFQRKKLS